MMTDNPLTPAFDAITARMAADKARIAELEAENRELTLRLNDQRTTAAALRKVASEAEVELAELDRPRRGRGRVMSEVVCPFCGEDLQAHMGCARECLARIAELEAENRELQLDLKDVLKKRDLCEARREQAETEAERVRRERDTWWAWHERQVLEQAEAELAALKGRRCETCKNFGICEVNRVLWSAFHEVEIGCTRWAERRAG
jgi:DNA repair exonuclease SbcCD ATPase subunit